MVHILIVEDDADLRQVVCRHLEMHGFQATIAYSIWHIFRIEDIVAHTVIKEEEQVFFAGNYQKRINSPIITTGNELVKQQIAEFSKQLNLDELYSSSSSA